MSLIGSLAKELTATSKYSYTNEKVQQKLVPNLSYKIKAKENSDIPLDTCPSFRARDCSTEGKPLREDISEKLQLIRKKYENQMTAHRASVGRSASPLQELNIMSKPSMHLDADIGRNINPTIQRTFSFINIESVESKPESVRYDEESFVEQINIGGGRDHFDEWKTKDVSLKKSTGI
jgi:hypothetical protein